jgi:nanoRNase/pAp phosphatase (c-di-AMP/oligoRNAs hydrolase)
MRVITSGPKYLDIDAYACMIAYAEFLNLQGIEAIPYSSAVLNESITPTIRSWSVPFSSIYIPENIDTFTIVDVSEPKYLDSVVSIDRVDEVIDHHLGYEDFWRQKGSVEVTLDFIGAAATLIYEKWVEKEPLENMSETSARLLISAILDNTLNFQAAVTNVRDHDAYNALLSIAHLPNDWTELYFSECQTTILQDIPRSLSNDTKMQNFVTLGLGDIAIGQLVIWDAESILHDSIDVLQNTMSAKSPNWCINLVSIGEKKSYFITDNVEVQKWSEKLLDVSFDGSIAQANRLWLRKEIVKKDLSS